MGSSSSQSHKCKGYNSLWRLKPRWVSIKRRFLACSNRKDRFRFLKPRRVSILAKNNSSSSSLVSRKSKRDSLRSPKPRMVYINLRFLAKNNSSNLVSRKYKGGSLKLLKPRPTSSKRRFLAKVSCGSRWASFRRKGSSSLVKPRKAPIKARCLDSSSRMLSLKCKNSLFCSRVAFCSNIMSSISLVNLRCNISIPYSREVFCTCPTTATSSSSSNFTSLRCKAGSLSLPKVTRASLKILP